VLLLASWSPDGLHLMVPGSLEEGLKGECVILLFRMRRFSRFVVLLASWRSDTLQLMMPGSLAEGLNSNSSSKDMWLLHAECAWSM
jgi:hypothetical protein